MENISRDRRLNMVILFKITPIPALLHKLNLYA